MQYISANTTIPIPRIYHYGTAAENLTGLGPFIIMDYIDHHQTMSRTLLDPKRPINERPVLDPNISEEKLEFLYGQVANILLQLFSLDFPRIGSLNQAQEIQRRPLTVNMNELRIHTNMPLQILPSQTYETAREWYSALADMHMAQLVVQYNDATEDDDDVCDKYIARKLFQRLANADTLWSHQGSSGAPSASSFKLFSQDLRPANILINEELEVVGVIDWEFAYAAPAEFSFDPPWWLLLLEPESWPGGYREWMKAYEPRLRTFLRVLDAEENKLGVSCCPSVPGSGTKSGLSLSQRMWRSWEARDWVVNYAARDSWAFDFVWWKLLDERYFGPNEDQDYRARLHLLSGAQKTAMDRLVTSKAEDRSHRKLFEWDDDLAAAQVNKLLAE